MIKLAPNRVYAALLCLPNVFFGCSSLAYMSGMSCSLEDDGVHPAGLGGVYCLTLCCITTSHSLPVMRCASTSRP